MDLSAAVTEGSETAALRRRPVGETDVNPATQAVRRFQVTHVQLLLHKLARPKCDETICLNDTGTRSAATPLSCQTRHLSAESRRRAIRHGFEAPQSTNPEAGSAPEHQTKQGLLTHNDSHLASPPTKLRSTATAGPMS